MAFNLTAELQLQANQQNINQVVGQIQNQLAPIGNVTVNVKTNTKAVQQAANQVQRLDKGLRGSQKSASELNRTLVESARRFSVITVATGSLLSLVNAFRNSVKSALDFEVELAKISQVTGKTVRELGDLTGEVRKLSRELGVGNKELLNTSRILLQTGLSAEKTKQALDVLARTTLAATFDNIQDTTEGAIALLNQFGAQAKRTGQDILFLEDSLDAINAVSKKFAVESSDLIGVVRRVGGVFSAAGGDVKELIALFTSVRQTTRESAETISTGLRTIFTRLQRTDTVDALKDLNIQLQDSKGQFVGAFEAVKRLSIGLSALDPKDFRFSAIVEELGGFRQVGKVIPLIKQFAVAQNALNVAQGAGGSIVADSITAQKTLANRFAKTREKFDELISQFADSSSFRSLANGFLTIADSLIKIGSAIEPVLPLLTALFALKVGSGLASGIGLLRGFGGGGGGGGNPIVASKFATGGPVPGSGNRDSVPAMLTPGEFVIRKSSVKKIGMGNLANMNAKGYASGGSIKGYASGKPYVDDPVTTLRKNKELKFNAGAGSSRRKANRFNSSDNLVFGTDRLDLDVSKYDGRFKEVKDYKNAETTSKRGLAFEKVAEKALGLKSSSKANSRLDAKKGREVYEIKSTQAQTNERAIGEKLLGAALNPIGGEKDPDAIISKRLSAGSLTENKDNVNLGNVFVVQDSTKGLGKGKKDSRSATTEATQEQFKKKALGGLIQKFAAGGAVQSILGQNKVGAVNLDVGKDNDVKLDVTLDKIKATQTAQKNNALKNKFGISKYLTSKGKSKPPSYTLKRKSIDEKTGDQFRKVLVDELVKGVDNASGRLGQDLIGQPVKATDTAIQGIREKFGREGGAVGTVYEDVLNVAANKGDFTPSSLFQPFDFPNGLEPPLVDNFAGVPNAFVDARKAQNSKDRVSFERKIANQIALEADASEFGKLPSSVKGSQKAQQAALGGMIKRFARGGAASDTVPAMLTPGEFVLNKDASQSIGSAKLDAMNKRGEVQGFNKGGAVQYLNRGGRPTGSSLGLSGQNVSTSGFGGNLSPINIQASVDNVQDAFTRMGLSAENFAKISELVEQALANGATEAEAFNAGMDEVVRSSKEAKDAAIAQAAEQQALLQNPKSGNTIASDENLSSAQNVGNNAAVGTASVQAVTAAAGNSEDLRSQLAEAQKAEILAITREIRQRDKNVSISDAKARAERVVENAYGALAKNIEVRKTLGQKLAQVASGMVQAIKGNLKATKDRVKALIKSTKALYKEEGIKGVAKATGGAIGQGVNKGVQATAQGLAGAQNLAFAGAAIGGVVASLGLFEEATNKAAAQAIAFGTTSLGLIATVAQTVAGFTASAAASTTSAIASQAQAVASGQATVADLAESKASFGAAGVIGIFVLAVTAAVSVLYFWSAQAKATAEKASKDFDTALKDLSGGSEGVASRLKAAAEVEVNSRAESAKLFNSSTVSLVAGSAAAGAALGSIVPVLGTAVGAAVGAITGAVVGLYFAVTGAQAALEEEKQAAQQETIARNEAIDGLVKFAKAVSDSEKEFKRIDGVIGLADQKNEEGFKETTLLKQQQTIKDIQATSGSDVATKADKTLQEIANRTGQTISELKGLKVDELAKAIRAGDQRNVAVAQKAVKQGKGGPNEKALDDNLALARKRKGSGAVDIFNAAKSFQIAALTVEKRAKLLEKNLANSSSQLQDLFADAPVDAAFEDLIKEGTAIGTALQIRAKALKANAAEEDRIAQEQIANLQKKAQGEGLNTGESEALAGLKQGIKDRKKATEDQIAQEGELLKQGQDARKANASAIREEVARRAAIIQALKQQEVALRDASRALKEAQNINSSIEFDTALRSDGAVPELKGELDLESPIPEDVIANVQKFGKSIDNLTEAQQKQARSAIDQVVASQKTAQQLERGLSVSDLTKLEGNPGKADEILKGLFPDGAGGSKITDDILLKAFNNVPEAVIQFKKDLEKAAKNGSLTSEEISALIAPIKEAGGKAGETLQLFNSTINAQIQKTNLLLKQENEARSKSLEAVNTYNDQILKGAEVIARAEGRDVKSSEIIAASQRALNAGKAGRGGRDLDAGDSQALALERKSAILKKQGFDNEIKRLRQQQQEGQLNDEEKKSLNASIIARNKEINTIKDVTKAQKAQISSLDSQIAAVTTKLQKAAEAREQGFAVLSEFVIGGKDVRKSLNEGAAGISKALQSGTLQNQSEEQRSKTVSLLDKLKDVQIGSTGLTGSQIKQELVFRDAIKLGFPPEVALELATSTSIEEKMLEELKALVKIQDLIARGLASQDQLALGAATGGLIGGKGVVYRSDGGSIFQPKGTDTVPAMLTPGEFVIRKSAVDKVGVGALSAINQGQPIYRANGGLVSGVNYLFNGGQGEKKTIFGSLIGDESDRPLLQRILQPEKSESLQKRLEDVDSVIPGPKVGFQRGEGIAGAVGRGAGVNESDKINYANRILKNSGPKSQVSALFNDQSEDIGPFANPIQSLAGLGTSIGEGARLDDRSGFSALNNIILGQGFGNKNRAPKTNQELLDDQSFGQGVSDKQFNSAALADSKNERAFLEKELVTLQNAYKSESDYQGINFSKTSIPRSELVASGNDPQSALDKRYNDIRSSIEQKIKALTGAIRYDEDRDRKAQKKIDDRKAYEDSKSSLSFLEWKEKEARRKRIEADGQYAGLGEQQIETLANSKNFYAPRSEAEKFATRGADNSIFWDSLAAEFVGSNYLWNKVDEDGKLQPRGTSQELNEGFIQAIKTATANAQAKWNERSEYDLNQNAKYKNSDNPSLRGQVDEQPFWNNGDNDLRYSAAKDEMFRIVSLKGSDPSYTPKKYDENSEIPLNKTNAINKRLLAKDQAEQNKKEKADADAQLKEQIRQTQEFVNAPDPIDAQIQANKKAQADYKAAPGILSRASDLILEGSEGLEKVQKANAALGKGDPKDLPTTYRGVLRQQLRSESERKDAEKLEEVRSIASSRYAEAKAQGFSEKYSISAGFRAVDEAKIEKTPASGKNKAVYYGRNDLIGLVQEKDKRGSVDGKPSRADRLKGFKTEEEAKAQTRADVAAKSDAASKVEEDSKGKVLGGGTKALNSSGQRRISPQAQRRNARRSGAGNSPIQKAAGKTFAFIDKAINDGWAGKSAGDRKNYLYTYDAGYRNALQGRDGYTEPQYYAIAAYSINRVLEEQKSKQNQADSDGGGQGGSDGGGQSGQGKGGFGGSGTVPKGLNKNSLPSSQGVRGGQGGQGGQGVRGVTDPTLVSLPALVKIDGSGTDGNLRRWEDRLNDPTASEGAKKAARRAIRDYNRKKNLEKNPLLSEDSEQGKKARRDEQIARSQAILDDPNVSEGATRAANQRIRDANRKNNPLNTLEERRGAARERFNNRLAEGGSEGSVQAANRGLRDLDRAELRKLSDVPVKFAQGGGVEGSDTIPAMLTPGEFVMSPEAVQRNGIGYMRNLNKGVVQGFRRGGLVGTGSARYRANGSTNAEAGGGGLSIDPSGLQQVLTEFSANFRESLDNVVATFSSINTSLDNLSNAINQGMTITHQFSGDMKMAFKIENGDQLKNSIAEALTPKISQIISDEVGKRLDENGFKAGG